MLKRLHLANARRVWRDLVQRAEKEDWAYDALLLTLFSEEVAHRRGTRLTRAVRAAQFPFLRTIDEFDFAYQSTLRLTTIGSLLTPDFVTEGHSVILEGKPGRGKTHLAIAIAYRAMQHGFDALFTTAAKLIDDLSAAGRAGILREALTRYMKPHVLVVDEVGYLAYGDDAANVLYHVVNDRHIRRRAMVFTTNKHPKRWGEVLHDDDLADAIVDRILERGRLLRLDGPSLRTKHLPDDELRLDDTDDVSGDRRVSGKRSAEFPERTGLGKSAVHDIRRALRLQPHRSEQRVPASEQPISQTLMVPENLRPLVPENLRSPARRETHDGISGNGSPTGASRGDAAPAQAPRDPGFASRGTPAGRRRREDGGVGRYGGSHQARGRGHPGRRCSAAA
ncbi:MAG: IS21-like element helper ATPase IstB [Solirubrobacteraceae bacterium]